MSPSTIPSTWMSPTVITSPVMRRSTLMMDGAALFGVSLCSGRLAFENILARLEELRRVVRLAVDQHLVVDVRAGAAARVAEQTDLVAIIHHVTDLHTDL